jgi:hypothetical protein
MDKLKDAATVPGKREAVNKKYLEKAGSLARAQHGNPLPIDDTYFKSVIETIKEVYASIYGIVIREDGDDERIADVLMTKGIMGVVVL